MYYVEHRSLFLDLYILLKTVIKVLKRSNVDEANLVETNRALWLRRVTLAVRKMLTNMSIGVEV